MSNEVKVGILAVIAIGISVWGFNYVMGKNLLTSSKIIKVEYASVSGLERSASVYSSGVRIGLVRDIYFDEVDPKKVMVELDLEGGFKLPKDAVAAIKSGGLMSGNIIDLEFARYCDGANCAVSGDVIAGRTVGMIEGMLGAKPESYIEDAKEAAASLMDTLNAQVKDENNDAVLAKTLRDLSATTENLRGITHKVNGLLSGDEMKNMMASLESLTGNLENNNAKINQIMDNAAQLTANLNKVDLEGAVNQAKGTLGKVDGAVVSADEMIGDLKNTLSTVDTSLKEVNGILGKIKSGEGSIGKLLNDDKLVKDLEETLLSVDELATELKEKPYNIIPFKRRKKVLKNREKDKEEGL